MKIAEQLQQDIPVLDLKLFDLGTTPITVGTVVVMVLVLLATLLVSWAVTRGTDCPEGAVTEYVNSLPERGEVDPCIAIDLLQPSDTLEVIALNDEHKIAVGFVLPNHVWDIFGQVHNSGSVVWM